MLNTDMTMKTIGQRLCELFGGSAEEQCRFPGRLSYPRRLEVDGHQRWLSSGGRFGRRLVIDARCTFEKQDLDAEEFSKASLNKVTFLWCNLRLARFVGSELRNVCFKHCDLEGADFSEASLDNVAFDSCEDLDLASFQGAIINSPSARAIHQGNKNSPIG